MTRRSLSLEAIWSRSSGRWRVAILIAIGGCLVHELRYSIAFGSDAAVHLEAHGHQHLDFTGPLMAGAVAVIAASWIASLRRPIRDSERPPPGWPVWLRTSVALIVLYCLQEIGEGLLAPGHPNVLAGVFDHGGWIALPLSVLVGAWITLALRGARAARAAVGRSARPKIAFARQCRIAVPIEVHRSPRSHVLATKLAGRAPPVAL